MAGAAADDATTAQMSPELVAPMVAFLAHEDCPVSGEIYAAGAGRFARIFIASTEGYVHAGGRRRRSRTSPQHWAAINDETGYSVPADLMDWSADVHDPPRVPQLPLEHLARRVPRAARR